MPLLPKHCFSSSRTTFNKKRLQYQDYSISRQTVWTMKLTLKVTWCNCTPWKVTLYNLSAQITLEISPCTTVHLESHCVQFVSQITLKMSPCTMVHFESHYVQFVCLNNTCKITLYNCTHWKVTMYILCAQITLKMSPCTTIHFEKSLWTICALK